MINSILLDEIDKRLIDIPGYSGFMVKGDEITVDGVPENIWVPVLNDVLQNADNIIANYEASIIRAEEERQAIILTVDATRPIEYVNFLTAPKEHILLWIDQHGTSEAFWAIICVLRYLVACKDRSKLYWPQ